METCYLIVIRCRNSDYGTIDSTAYQGCVYHNRFFFIAACPLCSIHFELKQLHSPTGSSLCAPETDITYLGIIIQISPIVIAGIDSFCSYEIVTQIPIGVIF